MIFIRDKDKSTAPKVLFPEDEFFGTILSNKIQKKPKLSANFFFPFKALTVINGNIANFPRFFFDSYKLCELLPTQ